MGQKKPVMTYRLVTRATIEERMMQKAKDKMVLEHLVVARMGKEGGSSTKLQQTTLDDILRYGALELFTEEAAAPQQEAKADGAAAGAEQAAAAVPDAGQQQSGSADGLGAAANDSLAQDGANGDKAAAPAAGDSDKQKKQLEAKDKGDKEKEDRAARLRIVYDDAGIDRLLDRTALEKVKPLLEDAEDNDDFMKAFKV